MKILLHILLIISSFGLNAQLITNTAQSPAGLVQNVLLGPGVTVSNIMYNGAGGSIGYFDGSATNLGINQGIVMTTGTVNNTGAGPHGPNNQANAGVDNGAGGSVLLSNIIGGATTYNAAILEFDFVPYSDTVKFRYVFGSEEYPEFAPPNNSNFNDVFGFFISGPGISGFQNIAQLPGGAGVVSINNVNPVTNSAYYINNGDGSSAPQNGSSFYIQYDGFTKVLTAQGKVQCGQTYHLVLAIADVGDGIYDSGIFLEANSLSSATPVDISYVLSQNTGNNASLMAEGCTSATITLERNNNLGSPLTIPITVTGTATEGVDYSSIPSSVTFAANQSQIQFNFDAFSDAIAEGTETLSIEFLLTDPCGNQTPIVINLSIQDVQPVSVGINNPGIMCPGEEVTLTAEPQGGASPYTYLWNTGATTSSITVSPNSTQTYSVSVTDNCLGQTASSSTTVSVPILQPLVITTSPDITEICPYITQTLTSSASGGAGNYTYQWTSNGQNLGISNNLTVTPNTTTVYTITAYDQCGNAITDNITYTITSPPLLLVMSPGVEICPGDSVLISVTATGGYGQYYYDWPTLGANTSQVWVHPSQTTSYPVIVSDECQTFTVNGTTTVTVVRPTADFYASSPLLFDDVPVTFTNTSSNAVDYFWEFGDGNVSTNVNPSNTYEEPGDYYITLIAIDEKGCRDTVTYQIGIEEAYYVYVPNAFTPDGHRDNSYFSASFYGVDRASVTIFNRWGELIFESNEMDFKWDGTYQGIMQQDGTYTWKIAYITNSGREIKIVGHINLLK